MNRLKGKDERSVTGLFEKGCDMDTSDYEVRRSGGGAAWFFVTLALIIFIGGGLAVGAYMYAEPQLTAGEAIVAGFAGLAALVVGIVGAAIGIVVGLFGALLGIVAAGGAVALTLFIVGSPIIAIILFVLLLRRNKSCPEPSAHE